jgi:catalase
VSNGNEGHSRRKVLTSVGRLSIAGAMGQAIASSSLISPAAAAQPNSEIAEKTFEATAENVVNALEAAYGVNRGKRRNHTKGFGALGIFIGAPEAAEYSRSQLFSGQEIEVVVVTLRLLIRRKVRGGLALNSGSRVAVCITSR